MTQVSKDHYSFEKYVQLDRWSSYYYQLQEIYSFRPSSVLEVGPGDGTVRDHLIRRGISYTSVDVAEDLGPDVIGSVLDLPFPNDSFDVVCAFEVLEHVPFNSFDRALAELARVSRGPVVISLPHFGPPIQLQVKVPFLPYFRYAWKIPYPRRHVWDGEHYWEIGKRGYSVSRIKRHLEKIYTMQKSYVPFEHQYHHFFVLTKRST